MKGNFVLLRAGKLKLVLPQAEVGAAHYIAPGDSMHSVALAESMQLLPQRPAERFIAAEFTGEYAGVAWCWDEFRVLIGIELHSVPVPTALQATDSPVHAYVEVDGDLAFLCSAQAICRYSLAEV